MPTLQLTTTPEVQAVFDRYPDHIRPKMEHLRKLVLQAAEAAEGVTAVEETLKWGEPSYLTKHGSTIRMDWKEKTPEQYAMYFKCTSRLVPTFQAVFGDLFTYEGTRAIVFQLEETVPEEALTQCIIAGLRYHKVKGEELLGI